MLTFFAFTSTAVGLFGLQGAQNFRKIWWQSAGVCMSWPESTFFLGHHCFQLKALTSAMDFGSVPEPSTQRGRIALFTTSHESVQCNIPVHNVRQA